MLQAKSELRLELRSLAGRCAFIRLEIQRSVDKLWDIRQSLDLCASARVFMNTQPGSVLNHRYRFSHIDNTSSRARSTRVNCVQTSVTVLSSETGTSGDVTDWFHQIYRQQAGSQELASFWAGRRTLCLPPRVSLRFPSSPSKYIQLEHLLFLNYLLEYQTRDKHH